MRDTSCQVILVLLPFTPAQKSCKDSFLTGYFANVTELIPLQGRKSIVVNYSRSDSFFTLDYFFKGYIVTMSYS